MDNALFIHVTLVPFIKAAGELKTKPTQQSIAKLREIGIQPHVLICRCEHNIDREVRAKLSMFCNVTPEAVIEERDVAHTIYEVPLMLQREKLDELAVRHLKLDLPPADMSAWRSFVDRIITPKHRVKIGVVGKYMENQDAYKSIYEALTHAGAANDTGVTLVTVDAEEIEEHGAAQYLSGLDGILFWSPADSACAAWREKSWRRVMRGRRRFRISDFVSGCKSRRLISRAMCSA